MSQAPLILICDHRGEGLAGLASRLSLSGFRIRESHQLRDSFRALREGQPDLVVVDPLVDGGELELDVLDRAGTRATAVPVLLVADRGNPRSALEAAARLRSGAWDLIYRDAPPEELTLRVERLLEEAHRIDELEEMRYRAFHDDRTDLLRPTAFQTRLEEHFSAGGRHGFELALLLIDLDAFGQVNKRFDHTVGDLVITQVGDAVRRNLRTEDVAGRLGGDEFAVLLPYTRKLEAAHVATRIRDEIHGLSGPLDTPQTEHGTALVSISASIGFETYDGTDLESVDELRAPAEAAMREAKRTGGNRGVYYRSMFPRRLG